MAIRYISKGKGKKRKVFPIKPKKGVSVRSVSLQPSVVGKVNREQIKLINRGQPATFSKALNEVVLRAKREGTPVYDTTVNQNEIRKPYHMWITDMKTHKKVKGSDTIVISDSYGQAVDDFVTVWNKDPSRMDSPIGYPVVQGTGHKSFRYKRNAETEKLKNILVARSGLSNKDINDLVKKKIDKIGSQYLSEQGAVFLVASDLDVKLSGEGNEKPTRFPRSVDELTKNEKVETLRVLNLIDSLRKTGLDRQGKQLQKELREELS